MRDPLRAGFVCLGVLALASCERPTEDSAQELVAVPAAPLASVNNADPCGTNPRINLGDFTEVVPCGAGISLSITGFTAAQTAIIENAGDAWDTALDAVDLGLPRFGPAATGAPTRVTRVRLDTQLDNSGYTQWCGRVSDTDAILPDTVHLWRAGNCGGTSMLAAATQELGHLLGFLDSWDSPPGTPGTTGHCAMGSHSNFVTGTICQHEIETIYSAFGVRTGSPAYAKHILTGFSGLPASKGMTTSGTSTLTVANLVFVRSNGSLGGCSDGDEPDDETLVMCTNQLPAPALGFDWSTSNAGVVSLMENGGPTVTLVPEGPGTATITARYTGSTYQVATIFTNDVTQVTVTAPAPASVEIVAGNNQTRQAGTVVPVDPSVRVLDGSGNPFVGATVSFTVGSGGGSVTGASQITNGNGIATVTSWTLGTTAGTNTLRARVVTTSLEKVFTATGTAGPAASVVINAGNNQTAIPGGIVPVDPAVQVRDANGNPVSGVTVTFAVTGGGGSVTGASQTTGANGIATVGSWTLGSSIGSNTLRASASGVATPVTFNATAVTVVAPANFRETACSSYTQVGKTYVDYTVGWTPGGNPSGTTFEIAEALTNNVSSAGIIASGASKPLLATQAVKLTSYLVTSGASPRYEWIRNKLANGTVSPWVPLNNNPLRPDQGCAN